MKDLNKVEVTSEKENIASREAGSYKENIAEKEGIPVSEDVGTIESGGAVVATDTAASASDKASEKAKRDAAKGQSSAGASGGAVGGVAAVAAVAVFVVASLISNLTVNFANIVTTGTTIAYDLDLKFQLAVEQNIVVDYDNMDTGLIMLVYDGNDIVTVPLITGTEQLKHKYEITSETKEVIDMKLNFSGVVQNLKPGRTYKMEVIGEKDGEIKKYAEKTATTVGYKTKVSGIEWLCECSVTGLAHFTLNYVDENNYYSNFKYELISSANKVVSSGSFDPSKTVDIETDNLPGSKFKLRVTFNSTAESDKKTGGVVTIELNVKT